MTPSLSPHFLPPSPHFLSSASLSPFTPFAPSALLQSIVDALFAAPPLSLTAPFPPTDRAVYVILYHGDHPLYADAGIVYVGCVRPGGSRSGSRRRGGLAERMACHRDSILAVADLAVEDFTVLALPLDDVFLLAAERELIHRLRPVWNCVLDGFGNHHVGTTRAGCRRSRFDTLHPGRRWVPMQPPRRESAEELARQVRAHCARMRVAA